MTKLAPLSASISPVMCVCASFLFEWPQLGQRYHSDVRNLAAMAPLREPRIEQGGNILYRRAAEGSCFARAGKKRAGYGIPPRNKLQLLDGARLLVDLDEFLDVVLVDQGAVDVGVDLCDLAGQQVMGDADVLRRQIIGVLQR